jgi:putative PIN family toxin of toxin-antitoxin system
MRARAFVVDTNVVVAGLLTRDPASPTVRVLDGMVEASFSFLLSTALLAEYRAVLLRPKISSRHGLDEDEIDSLLTEIVANAIVREPGSSPQEAPTRQDQHLWDLLGTERGTVLITGDQRLLANPPKGASVISPSSFVE